MPESSPALLPAVLLMFAGAGSAGLGAWVVSPHREAPWRRHDRHRGRGRNRDHRTRDRSREPRRHLAGAGNTHASRHVPATPRPAGTNGEPRLYRAVGQLRRPLR